MNVFEGNLPHQKRKRKWKSVFITVFLTYFLTLLGIYGFRTYGIALFMLTPFFIGLTSTILYGYKKDVTLKEATQISLMTLGVFALGLLVFAIEGLICIFMATPFALLFTWIGGFIGYAIIRKRPNNSMTSIVLIFLIIPTTSFIEKDSEPNVRAVTTKVAINASPEVVWKNVVEFPQLEEPTELMFKAGIAYPINAKIEGEGVGAIRHCNFNTGSFVEPITVWDQPKLLKFDVLEQPEPLKELSFWDIDAPHLHDYFVSVKGQFKLKALPNGQTELEGTTWYYNNIKPEFYWSLWSDWIIHSIHERVLNHIKINAEKAVVS